MAETTSANFTVRVEDDGAATFVIEVMGKEIPFPMTLDLLTELLATFGAARADIAGFSPPPEFQEGLDISAVPNPTFYVQEEQDGAKLLALFHPAYGALGFSLSPAEVARLARLLLLPPERSLDQSRKN